MTVKNLIINKDYDYIEWRMTLPETADSDNVFIGYCESKNGELISHDQDCYSKDEEVISHEEWSNEKVKNGLTVVVKGEWT